MPCDLKGPQDALVSALSGIDIVISAIFVGSLMDEIPLAEAAKRAGVKRFVQSAFMVVLPPRGAVDFRDKVRVTEGVLQLHPFLPYIWLTLILFIERGDSQLRPKASSPVHLY